MKNFYNKDIAKGDLVIFARRDGNSEKLSYYSIIEVKEGYVLAKEIYIPYSFRTSRVAQKVSKITKTKNLIPVKYDEVDYHVIGLHVKTLEEYCNDSTRN